jgi:hypothetical protein
VLVCVICPAVELRSVALLKIVRLATDGIAKLARLKTLKASTRSWTDRRLCGSR